MREITFIEATREVLAAAMAKDPTIFVVGEGIGKRGGNFNTTMGLFDLYGPERLRDTPISERGFVGLCTGAAMTGTRPVVDFMFIDFIMGFAGRAGQPGSKCAVYEQRTTDHAAVPRGCMGLAARRPPIIRAAIIRSSRHIRLPVVTRSTPYDAKGLFASALQSDDPVLFLEHRSGDF
ncbi:MAG: hypothetical protein R2911_43905 [Caldilineaceae bacterium]